MPCEQKSMRTTPTSAPAGSHPTRTGMILQPQAAPAMPVPLLVMAEATPAQAVPWLSKSMGSLSGVLRSWPGSPVTPVTKSHPRVSSMRPLASSSTPAVPLTSSQFDQMTPRR